MQQRRSNRTRAEAEFSKNLSNGDRVRDVRLATLALLTVVLLGRNVISALDDRKVTAGMVRPDGAK